MNLRDVDADGWLDLLFTQLVPGTGRTLQMARGHSGGFAASTVQIWSTQSFAFSPSWFWTRFVDWDGDGDEDVLLRTSTLQPAYLENRSLIGSGCPGLAGTPINDPEPAFVGSATFGFGLLGAAPVAPAVLVVSTASTYGPACAPLIDLGALIDPLTIPLTTSAGGSALVPLPLPNLPVLSGVRIYCQWGIVDPAGSFVTPGGNLALTPARAITIF